MLVSTSFLGCENPPDILKKIDQTDCDFIHVDVMDGKFVPGKTMPFKEMKNIYKYTSKRLDVHLMVEDAFSFIRDYAGLNTEFITIHVESRHVLENLKLIESYQIKPGIAIKPDTPLQDVIPYLPLVKQILIMSVEPGKSGQKFIQEMESKCFEARALLKEYKLDIIVSIDGGVNNDTISYCKNCDMVVSCSYIINSDDFQERINSLRR